MWFLRHGKETPYNRIIDDRERADGTFQNWVTDHMEYVREAYEKKKAYNRMYARERYKRMSPDERRLRWKRSSTSKKQRRQARDRQCIKTDKELQIDDKVAKQLALLAKERMDAIELKKELLFSLCK